MSDEKKASFKPKTNPPYSRTDLQHYLTAVITEKIDALKMPRDIEHDRRLLRALGAFAGRYMSAEGCKDPKYVLAHLMEGFAKEFGSTLAKEAKEEFKKQGKPPPPYLTAIQGGVGQPEPDEPEAEDDEGEEPEE